MRKIWNKGHRIRASDKHLVYHFSIGMFLVVFVAVLLLLNIKQLMRTDWEHFSLLENGLTLSPYNFITILIATGVCALVAFLYYRFCYDSFKKLLHRQKLARMVLENKWYEADTVQDSGFFTDLQSRSREKIVWFPKIYYQMEKGLLHIRCEITLGKYQDQLLRLEDKLESGLYCELTDKTLHDGYIEYTLLYDMIANRITIDEVRAENGCLRLMKNLVWEYDALPHALIAGGTGGGKTYFLLTLIEALLHTNAVLYILDPKNGDLADLGTVMGNVYHTKEEMIDSVNMGYSVDTGRNVYLQPSLASQGVKGTVTNALASAFVGSLGGGKSFCNNLLVYYSVLFGGQAVILDPKAERGNWKETLPEIAHEINIVNLTSDKDNAGLLDPFVIMKNVKDAESLAIDILTFLTGISSRDGEKFPVLRKAVRSVTQSDSRGLLHVIDELRREDTPISRNIADHIDSFTDYDFAHLLFSDGTVENAISLDNQLNIIQVDDLVLPDKDTTFEEYTTIELLSVSMLIVISTFALDFIHSDRSIFKIVDLDEAWAFLNVAQGETLSNKLVRAGRAMQAGVYFVTQSSGDVAKESLKNNIGLKFAFRSTDINEIKQTLEFFGIDKDDENNQKRLRDLENGQCLLQDLYGRVGVVQIHPVFEELLHAFDTRPPVQRNEVE